jgi:dihydroorotase
MFEERGLLDRLSGFVAGHAAAFYGLELSGRTITFEKESFKVPAELVGAVPFMHGEKISWSVVSE